MPTIDILLSHLLSFLGDIDAILAASILTDLLPISVLQVFPLSSPSLFFFFLLPPDTLKGIGDMAPKLGAM